MCSCQSVSVCHSDSCQHWQRNKLRSETHLLKHTNPDRKRLLWIRGQRPFRSRASLQSPSCYMASEPPHSSRRVQGGTRRIPAEGAWVQAAESRVCPADESLSKTLNQLLCNSLTSPWRRGNDRPSPSLLISMYGA